MSTIIILALSLGMPAATVGLTVAYQGVVYGR